MLQYITNSKNKDNLVNEVQSAVSGGCSWIQLRQSDIETCDFKDALKEVISICKEKDVILTIEDNPSVLQEYELHGLFMPDITPKEAIQLRQSLGAGPIIGFSISKSKDVIEIANADIDYVAIKSNLGAESIERILHDVRMQNISVPIVAITDDLSMVGMLMSLGVNGIALSKEFVGADETARCVSDAVDMIRHSIN